MKNRQMDNTQTPAQQVAADFAAQYTDEELNTISNLSLPNLEAYLEAVCLSTLEFAEENTGVKIHVLPGRPDRPKKPTV